MDQVANFLQNLGYQAALLQNEGPTATLARFLQTIGYLYADADSLIIAPLITICFAVFPIYTGAYASLARPASAAKPPKRQTAKTSNDIDDEDEDEDENSATKIETLGASDAIFIPLTAGLTLTGLYFLIKWLDDPDLISKFLNWYFALAGIFTTAALITDTLSIVHNFIFPPAYYSGGQTWLLQPSKRRFQPNDSDLFESSPLPPPLYSMPLPTSLESFLWSLRELPNHKFHLRLYVYKLAAISLKLGPFAIFSTMVALGLMLYTNILSTPWYINNLYGFAFVYSSQQMISPSTGSTASLLLSALFLYDIYFVFYTPIMVTVATSLDIPAKLLIPRFGGMGMLGLGDLAIPGMVMAWALRFDLWLYYYQKQKITAEDRSDEEVFETANGDAEVHVHYTRSRLTHHTDDTEPSNKKDDQATKPSPTSRITKPTYRTATGSWGTRFWLLPSRFSSTKTTTPKLTGPTFPTPYFSATLRGYILGLFLSILFMHLFRHPQPALLYLVPCVLGSLWTTAWRRSEVRILHQYDEGEGYSSSSTSSSDPKDEEKSNTNPATKKPHGIFAQMWREIFPSKDESDKTLPSDKEKKEKQEPDGSNAASEKKKKKKEKKDSDRPAWIPPTHQYLYCSLRRFHAPAPHLTQTGNQIYVVSPPAPPLSHRSSSGEKQD